MYAIWLGHTPSPSSPRLLAARGSSYAPAVLYGKTLVRFGLPWSSEPSSVILCVSCRSRILHNQSTLRASTRTRFLKGIPTTTRKTRSSRPGTSPTRASTSSASRTVQWTSSRKTLWTTSRPGGGCEERIEGMMHLGSRMYFIIVIGRLCSLSFPKLIGVHECILLHYLRC